MRYEWMDEFRAWCKWRVIDPGTKIAVDQFKEFKRAGLTF